MSRTPISGIFQLNRGRRQTHRHNRRTAERSIKNNSTENYLQLFWFGRNNSVTRRVGFYGRNCIAAQRRRSCAHRHHRSFATGNSRVSNEPTKRTSIASLGARAASPITDASCRIYYFFCFCFFFFGFSFNEKFQFNRSSIFPTHSTSSVTSIDTLLVVGRERGGYRYGSQYREVIEEKSYATTT